MPSRAVTYHSMRRISSTFALFKNVSLQEVFASATCALPCTLSRAYKVNIIPPSSLSAEGISENLSGQPHDSVADVIQVLHTSPEGGTQS